ncbi:MAG: hypothetical protein ACT4OS_06400 [Acidimicrobiales bacterium]
MEPIDELLAEADRMRGAIVEPPDPDVIHMLKEMTMLETETTKPLALPRRRRLRTMASIALAAVAIPTAAVAINGGIHTGIFGGKGDTELVSGEELLNLSDPAIVEVVREVASRTPLPPGDTFETVLDRYPRPQPTTGQQAVIVTEVQAYAQCRWYSHWLIGDTSTRQAALSVIEQFPSWEFVGNFAPGDSGPQLVRDTVSEVRQNKESLVRQFLTTNC